ncbi:N-acetyl-gamma-glutamyl-phosphate reductase [Bordetella avium]|uniref:N-acetyl-gamma-glutamyl-phosphate reductase n=1 Tax=Bordetella avium (strain 197N) TaxID=360910 RepID=ARGC_BORA1|nr:N-acetyl-gamma-glutamyl-phosphate reductase [Bordetella avium]Q2KV05.1 RecName: Full=N-acetyl-gamma-glutamyl-phosphate reductase; Short=AGPR; AltName: Full=N-acetyl-glutamate semialdehyde dehydrogenase; Short=NAGSA dehydrogenase [Bordetella avium 197N]AZY50317.1 N-acetyl-gamma-glutamyl-phosphate reductase [Bordetella avium]AZY53711.1 N-acetyl-gamma-glutamyl-phosphate reductase [Bordetella avium]RIQ15515.1 N-acetyl-gamma-glutamyl-phosphate reductase [Bordetella avium]RIQ19678.1 N-acetyl-gamm
MAQARNSRIKVGIVGGTGYTGVELLRLLSQHPDVELTAITSRKEDGLPVAEMYPNLRGHVKLAFSAPEKASLTDCDVVFFATPHGVAMAQAQALTAAGTRVIDLAADFRLQDTASFERWYKMPHGCPDILAKQSAYGLVELNRAAIAQAQVIGNPGCYPTTVILGLAPLLERKLIDTQALIADCKSGVSGAGRKAEVASLFSEASDNFKAYGVAGHRHHPEITEQLEKLAGGKVGLTFVPHLVPMIRGMFSTIYARILPEARETDFQALFEERYAGEAFIDVMPAGSLPETRSVRASNNLRIAVQRPGNGDQLIVLVVQDNLVKGAAGQAVQNMNLMFGLPETTGLNQVAILP